jgi:hypothetical protein
MASEQGGKDEFGLHFWVPARQEGVSDDDCWGGGVDSDEMKQQLGSCEPRYNFLNHVFFLNSWLIKDSDC